MSYAILLSNPANAMVVLPVPPDDIVNDVSGPPAFLTTSKSAVLSNTSFVVSVTVIVNAPEPFVVPVKNCCVVSDIFAKLFGLIYGVGNNKSFLSVSCITDTLFSCTILKCLPPSALSPILLIVLKLTPGFRSTSTK